MEEEDLLSHLMRKINLSFHIRTRKGFFCDLSLKVFANGDLKRLLKSLANMGVPAGACIATFTQANGSLFAWTEILSM